MSKGKEQIQPLVKSDCGLSILCPRHRDMVPWQMVLNAFKPQRYQKLFNKRTDDSHKQKSSNKTTILHFCMFGPVGYDQEFFWLLSTKRFRHRRKQVLKGSRETTHLSLCKSPNPQFTHSASFE